MSRLPWVRLDTQFSTNPKVLALVEGKAFRALFVYSCGLGYSGAHGTDGFIPASALPFLHGTKGDAAKLVEVHMWVPCPGGWDINGWADFQPSSEEHAERRKKAKEAAYIRWGKAVPGQRPASEDASA